MKTALILIDIQNDYFPGGPLELKGITEATEKAANLLGLFRANRWPTFHIQHLATKEDAFCFAPNTTGVEINDRVKPLPDDMVIQKQYANSFRDTPLLDKLKRDEIKRLVICGAMSHMCVDATTRAAFDLGFNCIVIHDACATRDLKFAGQVLPAEAVHGSFMAALSSGYAKVIGLNEFKSDMPPSENR